ncbi:MAG: hypothetical protein PHU49_00290 [Syntrophorhabdaceae bacterium]|nr:hypothetical protein [Syntrophorhabdaceae bacterium]
MAGKSIASRALNRKQRQKMNMSRYSGSKLTIRPENMGVEEAQVPKFSMSEHKCQFCGFKARYKFYRCPQCDSPQKA